MMNNFVIDERELVAEFRENTQEQFLKYIEQYEAYIAPIMRANGYRRINQTERTVLFTFGEITFSRSRWTNGKRTRIPLDEKLGLKKHTRFSKELLYYVSKLSTMLSYRQVGIVIETCLGFHVTKDTVLKAIKEAGELLKQREECHVNKPSNELQKIKSKFIYVEGDGVMVKCTEKADERRNRELSHFVVHTGRKQISPNRYMLENKKEIVHINYNQAKDDLLDYLYNHFEITPETVLITNSDNGKGYTRRIFLEIAKALGIKRHEHFWDAYHVDEKIRTVLKNYPEELTDRLLAARYSHNKSDAEVVFDTCEAMAENEEDEAKLLHFKYKFLKRFSQTKSAALRGLPTHSLGIMESQHRKLTYRMKKRGMYWSENGACTMARMILLDRLEDLRDLFFGEWQNYSYGRGMSGGEVKKLLPNETDHSLLKIFKQPKKGQLRGLMKLNRTR
ncbi:ISLre2 family transposase [Streptococcus suis]|nr:ISLre2 family transposase [Streptococcus suis]